MPSILNATTTTGLVTSADNSGSLQLATNNGTTAVTIGTDQRVAFVAGTAALPVITTTGDLNTGIFFPAADTIAFAEGGAEVARFDSNGNLLIGTTSASGFDSGADNLIVGGGSGSTGMTIYSGTTGVGAINFADGTTGSDIYAGGIVYNHNTNNLDFATSDGTSRMRLNANDSVLNGSAVPDASGNPTTNTISIGGSGWYATMTGANNYWNHSYNGTTYNLRYRGSGVGSIVVSSGSVAFNTTSDYRLKENIQPMVGALAKVVQLKPCTYTWKATGETNEGFIAHELAEVCPQAVTGQKDALEEDGSIRPQGIDTSFLAATLTAAIQELNAKVDAQALEIQALKGVA
jgi:hypothetical protein